MESLLEQICGFFAAVLGPQTEIVVHDMQTGDILYIANGAITGRSVGQTDQRKAVRLLSERARHSDPPHRIVGCDSRAQNGTQLRSSTLFLSGEDGDYRYSICVNQDITMLRQFQGFLAGLMGEVRPPASPAATATVETLIMDIILGEIERAKPFSLDSREARMRILRRLDEKGVFEVRHAGAKVCELLEIAQPTLYKYLKEIRNEQEA